MKALITGASSGIGRDMARYLSGLGYDLIIVARRENLLEELKKDLTKTEVIVEKADISDPNVCKELFEKHPDIDILINNAGFGKFGEFDKTELNDELNMIDTNIVGLHTL
ncbi:MAG: SDR family NAD(P)-dependent oxidoreductase, partial [Clostridia bacterium]|nr:SDR family NAD(P)-dependent oxidoreductase [Clostridia bacterium]